MKKPNHARNKKNVEMSSELVVS